MADYDEFGYFQENLDEWDLAPREIRVRRSFVAVEGLRQVSALVWGDGPPVAVLLHGSAQNAHTFDTVALALDRPLVAVDLPHHGHSDASFYGPRAVLEHARDVALALPELIDPPRLVVAMSYGGLVGIALAHEHPELVSRLVLVDITPGEHVQSARAVTAFVNGPESFASFDEMQARTIAFTPDRSESSLRRGVAHNAIRRGDGRWVWRHQQHTIPVRSADTSVDLWDWLSEIRAPVTLVRAMGASSVVTPQDEEEYRRRRPTDEVHHVLGASHSIQSSHPLELSELLRRWL